MKPTCVVSCPIDTFSGYGARSRDFVKSLIELKGEEWDIKILPQRWGECPWNYLSQDDPLRKRFVGNIDQNNRPDIWIQISVPNEFTPVGTQLNILKDVKENFCFLFTGHWLPGDFGEDRKNIATLIKTFLETFKGSGRKRPALILKLLLFVVYFYPFFQIVMLKQLVLNVQMKLNLNPFYYYHQ